MDMEDLMAALLYDRIVAMALGFSGVISAGIIVEIITGWRVLP
jgi:hypothetical protein